jgi:hypothetical protein
MMMTQTYQIAHIHEQGQDMIFVPMNREFRDLPDDEKLAVKEALQLCAMAADLRGVVVPVWEDHSRRTKFIAPPQWHNYLSTLSLAAVHSLINRQLTCG